MPPRRPGPSDASRRAAKRQANEAQDEAERVENVAIIEDFATIVLGELQKNAAVRAAKAAKASNACSSKATNKAAATAQVPMAPKARKAKKGYEDRAKARGELCFYCGRPGQGDAPVTDSGPEFVCCMCKNFPWGRKCVREIKDRYAKNGRGQGGRGQDGADQE